MHDTAVSQSPNSKPPRKREGSSCEGDGTYIRQPFTGRVLMPESKTSLDGYSIPEVLRGENSKIKTKENLDVKAKTKV